MDIELTPGEVKQFKEALISAFRRDGLEQVVYYGLEVPFDDIVANSNFDTEVNDLVMWVNGHNKVEPLLKEARSKNSGNLKLRKFDAYIQATRVGQSVSPGQTADIDLDGRTDQDRKFMSEEYRSLERQLVELRANQRLIEERKAEYVQESDIPLQLVKDERRLGSRIVDLEAKMDQYEQALAEEEGSAQVVQPLRAKAAAPLADAANVETQPKPEVQVEPASSQADKAVESPPSADIAKSESTPKPAMPSSSPDDTVRLFLSYAREDFEAVSVLYDRLEALGLRPWMDKYDILPGERWETKLSEAIRESHFFLACLSAKSVEKRGYLQREFKQALDLWQQKLAGDIYLIPVRLDECQVPETLRAFQWANLYEENAWWELLRAIRAGAERQGLTPPQELRELPRRGRPVPKSGVTPAAQPQRSDRLVITDPLRLELVRVPAGEFLMGSDPAKDKGAYDNEKPQHRLTLPKYYIGKYPVTNEQYAVFVRQTQGAAPSHWQGGKIPAGKEKHLVVNVSWHDARAFCAWVSEASGGEIRLPSEAEWEKAARGVDGRLYPWGNEAPNAELCNFTGSKIRDTTPVDRYPKGASPYGALDMAGNVWDWTGSLWGKDSEKSQFGYPYEPTDGREDLQAAGYIMRVGDLQVSIDIRRVLRGGEYKYADRLVRCAVRAYLPPNTRDSNVGFRVVCVSPPHHASGL